MKDLNNMDIFQISEILLESEKEILKDITGTSLLDLLDKISKSNDDTLMSIYSSEKIIKDSGLVKMGIYPYRALLSEKTVEYRRKKLGLDNNKYYNTWLTDGIIKIENFIDDAEFQNLSDYLNVEKRSGISIDFSKHKDFKNIVEMCLATNSSKHYHPSLGSEYIIHYENDDQVNLHSDIFHPNLKIWLYINDTHEENGPYCFVYGSHKKTPEMLEFIHKNGIVWDAGPTHVDFFEYNASETAVGSPRLLRDGNCANKNIDKLNKKLEELKLPEVSVMSAKKNTIIFTDTTGFHARGYAEPGSIRYSLRNAFRINPFML